jgi:hypothetical protein
MDTLLNIIKTWIQRSTTITSDCWAGYIRIPKEAYTHHTVNPTTNLINQCTGAHMNPDAVTWKHVKVAFNLYNQRTYYVYYLAVYMSNTLCHAPAVNQFTLFTDTVRSVDWALWPVRHKQPPPATFSKSLPLLHTPPKPVLLIPTTFICIENFLSMVLQCSGIRG